VRGRCFRGRKHFGVIAESQTELDHLTGAAVTLWDTVVAAFSTLTGLTDGNGNTWDLVVLSRKNSVLDGPSITFTYADMTSVRVSEVLGTMRHRKERKVVTF